MTGVGFATGAVAGLVAITPASGYVGPMSAIIIGCAASLVSFYAIRLKTRFGYDDALDVFGVHGISGMLGALLTGVFASVAINPAGADGSLKLVGIQAAAVAATVVYSGIMSFALLKIIGAVTPLRVEEAEEFDGTDLSEHGERAYSDLDSGSVVGHPAGAHAAVGVPQESIA